LPNLPAFAPGEDGDRVADCGVFDALEIRGQQGIEFFPQDAEGRAFRLLAKVEVAGEPGAGGQQFGDAPAPVGPQLAGQGAKEGAFVDQGAGRGGREGEEVGADEVYLGVTQHLAGDGDGGR